MKETANETRKKRPSAFITFESAARIAEYYCPQLIRTERKMWFKIFMQDYWSRNSGKATQN